MKGRTIGILVGALALLSLLALLAERADQTRRESRLGGGPLLGKLEPAAIAQIAITSKGVTWTMQRVDEKWLLAPTRLPADSAAVDDVISQLLALDRRELAATTAAAHTSFGLEDANPTRIEVRLWGTEVSGDPTSRILVGQSASDYTASYVRLADDDRVYQTSSRLTSALDRGDRGFRDPTLLTFDGAEARRLELTSAGVTTLLERGDEPQWRFVGVTAETAAKPADSNVVDDILRLLSRLEADSFPADGSVERTGLDAPLGVSKVTLADGQSFAVSWGKEEGGKVYAQKSGDDTVVSVFAFKRNAILRAPADLERRTETPPQPPEGSGE